MKDDQGGTADPPLLQRPCISAEPTAPIEGWATYPALLPSSEAAGVPGVAELQQITTVARGISLNLHTSLPLLDSPDLVAFASATEELSRLVDHIQISAAAALDRARICAEVSGSWPTPVGKVQQEYKNTAEYMRHRLRISRREAWKRIRLGSALTPAVALTGQPINPELPALAERSSRGEVSGEGAQMVSLAIKHVQGCGTSEDRAAMEVALADVAASQDLDALSVVASAWVNHLDPDGTEPTEQQKAEQQGLFIRRKYRGLHHLNIYATDDQFETLMTALAPETNPRNGAGPAADGTCEDLEGTDRAVPSDPRTYQQKCLDGLITSCKLALSSGQLPANGGSKPQVLAIVPYEQLRDRISRKTENGTLAFSGPVPPHQIRRIACDADIIPVVLNGEGRVLDVGTAARYFPPHLRKAIIARDGGCAFPGCTSPAPCCEAHHIDYHSRGGPTSTDNGVMLCGFHHHLIHREKWRVNIMRGVPWFIPPTYVDPFQAPLRNTYFHPLRPHRQIV